MDQVLTTTTDGVMHIALNRPAKRNAITIAMYGEITRLLRAAEADDAIGCVVISGDDGLFTAGNDLLDFLQAPPSTEGGGVIDFLKTVGQFRKPLGAAVGGLAVGIGVTLLFHCDFVVAADSARFSAPFVDLGLIPEAGATYLAPRQIGHKAASRLFLLGEMLDARQALEIGLISHVVETAPVAAALAIGSAIAARPRQAAMETRRLLRQPDQAPMLRRMNEEATIFAELVRSDYCTRLFRQFLAN